MFSLAQDYIKILGLQQSYVCAGITLGLAATIYATRSKSPIDAIPAVGKTGIFTSYISALQWLKHADAILKEGYDKYGSAGRVFRIPDMSNWLVIVSDPKHIKELCQASDHVFSFREATRDNIAANYTLGQSIMDHPYHVPIVRSQLTRNLAKLFPDMRDELVRAFDDEIPETDDWIQVGIYEKILRVVSRTSNRIFVGAPTCRISEYIDLTIKFTIDVILSAKIINLFPKFLKPLVGRMLTHVPKAIQRTLEHLGPIIEERMQKITEHGPDYPDKPNDLLSWLMDEARGEERTTESLTRRMLTISFAAIHTSSMSFTNALYSLAANPHHIGPLREEIETIIAEDGWSKASLARMRKLDSILKESLRTPGLSPLSTNRKVLVPFTFSDSTLLPKGAMVSVYLARHMSEEVYHDAQEFRGFRFSDLREEEGEGAKNQSVATSIDYMPFGHGRHACPGRFFAANELKAMMAHVILTYDFKLENEGVRPPDEIFASARVPNRTAKILFRRRQKRPGLCD